jgi:hypothetical protein
VSHGPSRAGGDGTGSSTGRTGHRSTAASIIRRRAELARPLSRGRCAVGLRLGAARRASAARVTFAWLIQVAWSIRGPPAPATINRRARIHRNNRRAPPAVVTPAMSCDDCDEREQGEAVTRSSSLPEPQTPAFIKASPNGPPDRLTRPAEHTGERDRSAAFRRAVARRDDAAL